MNADDGQPFDCPYFFAHGTWRKNVSTFPCRGEGHSPIRLKWHFIRKCDKINMIFEGL